MAEREESGLEADIDLRYYLQVLLRRRWIVLSALVLAVAGAALVVYTATPVYSATALVLIEKERRNQAYASDGVMVETTADDYYQTQYMLLKSRSLLTKVHKKLELDRVEEFRGGPGALDGAVSISPVRRSRLVQVSAESSSPERAALIANTVSELFVQENVESKLFISREIMRALFPGQAGAGEGPRISLEALPPVVNSQLIQQFKGEYVKLESRMADLSKRYTPEHPEMARLKSQMESLERRIAEETRNVVQGMKAELSGQLLGNNVRIIDPALVPGSPSKPRKKRTLLLASLLGLSLGYLLALVVDALDQTIHSQEDIERRLSVPFLGSIPMAMLQADSAEQYKTLLEGPKSFTGESLKNIRTMVGFAGAGKPLQALLLTSTGQGEGKTFIAISLAMVFAQLGEKVLLIEGDLRRPNLHKRFRLSKEKGMSHFLAHSREAAEAGELIQRPAGVDNLDVLVCGKIPPNPAELLSTPRLEGLLRWARGSYDRILIDGTPIFPITDALLWARHADAAVFVVKFGGTNGSLATKAVQKLNESGLKVAGAVVNQVTAKANGYYGDYYYYYYYHSDYIKQGKSEEPA